MATRSVNSIAEQLKTADLKISNSLTNEDVKAEVAKRGYDEAKLLEGKGLLDIARTAVQNSVSFSGEAKNSTLNEQKCRIAAHKAYQDFAQICRSKFKNGSPELAKLGLVGKEPASTAEFIKGGYTLFDNAASDPDILAKVSINGYTVEVLADEKAKITAYENANKDQVSAEGASTTATAHQQNALKALHEWISEYTKIAKVALSSSPKLLEKIGIQSAKKRTAKRSKSKNVNPEQPK